MTSAPEGGCPPSLTLVILFPFTTISTLWRGWSEVPSINVAARIAIIFPRGSAWLALLRDDAGQQWKKENR